MSHRPIVRKPRTKPASIAAAPVAALRGPTPDQIRARAYEIYLARGCAPGSPDMDWRQAELELRARIALLGKP